MMWTTEWLSLFVLYAETATRFFWTWVGQPVIFVSAVVYWHATRRVAAATVLTGCVMNLLGRLLTWCVTWAMPSEGTREGHKILMVTPELRLTWILWEIGNIVIAAGVLAFAISTLRTNRGTRHEVLPLEPGS